MHRGRAPSKGPSAPVHVYQQPPRLLVMHAVLPSWAGVCSNLCDALHNFFSITCSLRGPSRVSLLSVYVVQAQHECILPFVQVKGNFARLQTCVSELRVVQREGCFRAQRASLNLAVQDGLQQFQQYSRHVPSSMALPFSCLEVTVVTSQPGKEVAKQLEEGLKNTNLSRVRRLQVVEITDSVLESMDSAPPLEELAGDENCVLGTDIDLQTIDNDTISIEIFFKAWLHYAGTDQEHVHLLLPPRCSSGFLRATENPMCLKCDLQERLLSPGLLPGSTASPLGTEVPMEDLNTQHQTASQASSAPYRLRVIKALKFSGVCESLMYGLPFILRPTSCWQLDWDELETNQQHFHALCHSLLKREWLLLARGESPSPGSSQTVSSSTFYVIMPSPSLTLLVKAMATRELMLPNSFPPLLQDTPDDSLGAVESALDSLELEATYNPLRVCGHLYERLSSTLTRPRGQTHWESRSLRKVAPHTRGPPPYSVSKHPCKVSRVRATVAPLPITTAPSREPTMPETQRMSSAAFVLPSEEEEEEEEAYL
ncbi:PREDICTED: meiosis 1 arrest protein [Elephantulus edwardii]|uniref:meiosis 1 arrest protein n=1 Tax=Elephantulus edwardii TaxID=28737 RepID=UPI0003F096D9|nr:PREDICTED: meiosis 1 arrest protein [Elephantulus edwardii]